MKTGTANLPLHYGATPRWLFNRMTRLAREIAIIMVDEHGSQGFLKRLADPFWFQAFGCALGFDWHSSGVTTTVCGALKAGLGAWPGDQSPGSWLRRMNPASKKLDSAITKRAKPVSGRPMEAPFMGRSSKMRRSRLVATAFMPWADGDDPLIQHSPTGRV